jgi:hypothetical protein
MTTSKNIFTFFSNGENVNTIKNHAKKAHKNGEYKSRLAALNSISHSISGKPFNKAVSHFKELSPYMVGDSLYVPLINGDDKYFITITSEGAMITEDYLIDFCNIVGLKLGKVSYSKIEKLDNGWMVILDLDEETDESDRAFLEIKATDEGIIVDLWYSENDVESEAYEVESIDTTGAMYDEVREIYPVYSNIDFKGKNTIDDFRLSIQLNHKTIDESTIIAKYGENTLQLVGCVTISTPDGEHLYGEKINKLVAEGVCSRKELDQWFDGEEIDSLSEYTVDSNPWFEIINEGGDPLVECIEYLSNDKNEIFETLFS